MRYPLVIAPPFPVRQFCDMEDCLCEARIQLMLAPRETLTRLCAAHAEVLADRLDDAVSFVTRFDR